MSEIVNSILSSSNIISSPVGEAVSAESTSDVPTTDKQVPTIADFLGLSAFYSPNVGDFNPEMVYNIKTEIKHGKSQKQAIAIALSNSRKSKKK